MRRLSLLLGGATALAALPVHAQDRAARSIQPYVEVSQILTADLDDGDVLTYSSVAVGVDAAVQSRRVEVQASYRYEHRFGWDNAGDDDIHSGLVQGLVKLTPGLQLDAGALATRARSDFRGAAPGFAGDNINITKVYSAYAGPTFASNVGPATVNAAYRFGYTKVETPDATGVPFGQPRLDYFDSSTNHMAMASVGVRAGEVLPIGFTVSGAWEREDVSQLDQRYDGKYARADVVLPVSPTLALTAGVGYENIELSQRDALVTTGGAPVIDGNGRFVTDPASPRRIAYDFDGIYYDAGVMWRPSNRTTLTASVGRRYDTTSVVGSFSWQIDERSGLQVGVYDSIESFGRGMSDALAKMPTAFNTRPDPFGDQFNGCVFGRQGSNAGGCLNPILGAIATAQFRSRGIDAVYSAGSGPLRYGAGAGYANRKFLVPRAAPGLNLNGVTDEIYYAQAFIGRDLSARSTIDGTVYFNYFDSGVGAAGDVMSVGGTGSYTYSFGRFGASATLGVFAFDQKLGDSDVSAQGSLGMRYSF